MNKLILLILLPSLNFAQSVITTVEVLDRVEKTTNHIFSGNSKGVAFNLVNKTIDDRSNKAVIIELLTVATTEVGRARSVAVDGNLNIGLSSSRITQTNTYHGNIELNAKELEEVINFLNWSLGKKNPSQQKTHSTYAAIQQSIKDSS